VDVSLAWVDVSSWSGREIDLGGYKVGWGIDVWVVLGWT
jgi:hypothetical protein